MQTLLELVTSKYPRTFFIIRKSTLLYTYAVIYGVFAVIVFVLYNVLK